MKYLISLLLLAIIEVTGPCYAGSLEDMKMKMSLNKNKVTLAQRNTGTQKATGERSSPGQTKEDETALYVKAYNEAWENRRPLIVWVNLNGEAVESRLSEALHVHVSKYKDVADAGIVIGIRSGDKFVRYDLDKNSSVQDIKNFLAQKHLRLGTFSDTIKEPQPYQPHFGQFYEQVQPQYFSQPSFSQPMRGGFSSRSGGC